MTYLLRRRMRNTLLTGLAAGAVLLWVELYDTSLRDQAFLDGWILFGAMVLLLFFNLRKKLPVLPLLSATAWLQFHIYLGLLCTVIFFIHTGFRFPDGVLETVLWVAYLSLTASGIAGLMLTRSLPSSLGGSGERVIFERLPTLRAGLASQAEALAIESVRRSNASTVADFYGVVLGPYFLAPSNFWSHLFGSKAPLRRIRGQIEELKRFQDTEGREALAQLDRLAEAKDGLDHQYALQLTLKSWLFIHIPLGYGVVAMSLVHVLLVYAFASAAP